MGRIESFALDVPEAALLELRSRLAGARWPERETVRDWSQGVPLDQLQALCAYWAESYDWRRCERLLNRLGQFRTEVDGMKIHFLHVRSAHVDALPMLLSHGWPGSIIEFIKIIALLVDPTRHGGRAEDAFHLVIPSLPGFGFSQKPASTGWGVRRIASAWVALMRALGYRRYVAQGGDWGAAITTHIAHLRPPECAAIHLNMPMSKPNAVELGEMTQREREALDSAQHYQQHESGYARQQSTRPQTIGYGLVDSPVAQAAWIYEKLRSWSDCNGVPEDLFGYDAILDNIMLYWLPATGASSARLYWESLNSGELDPTPIELPVGCSVFPKELFRPSRRWAEKRYRNIIYWNELDRGGHFAAFEQPAAFAAEMRRCFAQIR
jgi:epoxide hydrolase